ncbi:MAG: hypothetical protein HYW95_01485 [Candidatus Wildermuthbacteria bacterium]|nr:hypothetical protein [Candidatus Wildermuthbacteria bacterium]
MVATTKQKARLLDLTTGVLELIRDGKRDADEVCNVLQVIKEERDFASILRRDQQVLVPEFKIWKTVKLGLRKSPREYRKALDEGKYQIGTYASQILDKTSCSQEVVEVDLVLVTGSQLGFKVATRRDLIYKRALELGLQRCPGEVGPAMREQYLDQPMDEWFLIGMDPITDSDGNLRVFIVVHDGSGLWLDGSNGDPDRVWNPGFRWAFVLPRK